jgi:hypothetical protein
LSFVDPNLTGLPDDVTFSSDNALVARLVDLTQRDKAIEERLLQLCHTELPSAKRELLAKVVGNLGNLEAVTAGLALIDDMAGDSGAR